MQLISVFGPEVTGTELISKTCFLTQVRWAMFDIHISLSSIEFYFFVAARSTLSTEALNLMCVLKIKIKTSVMLVVILRRMYIH